VLNCSAIFLHRLINQVRLRPTWAVFEKKFEGLIWKNTDFYLSRFISQTIGYKIWP